MGNGQADFRGVPGRRRAACSAPFQEHPGRLV